MLQPVMRRTHPSWGFHSLLSAAFVGYFLLRWRTVPHSAFRVIIEKIRRHASARHEEHASFMGVPQSTKCGFCWILSPSLGNSSSFSLKDNAEKMCRHVSARHEEHASFMGVPQSTWIMFSRLLTLNE